MIAHILDPRAKMKFVELLHGESNSDVVHYFSTTMRTTFDKYFKPAVAEEEISCAVNSWAEYTDSKCINYQRKIGFTESSDANTFHAQCIWWPPPQHLPDELQIYLAEPLCIFDTKNEKQFDILCWVSTPSTYGSLILVGI